MQRMIGNFRFWTRSAPPNQPIPPPTEYFTKVKIRQEGRGEWETLTPLAILFNNPQGAVQTHE